MGRGGVVGGGGGGGGHLKVTRQEYFTAKDEATKWNEPSPSKNIIHGWPEKPRRRQAHYAVSSDRFVGRCETGSP